MVLIRICNRMVYVTLPGDSILAEASKSPGGKTFRKRTKARCWTICAELTNRVVQNHPVYITWSWNSGLNKTLWFKRFKKEGSLAERWFSPPHEAVRGELPLQQGSDIPETPSGGWRESLPVWITQGLVPDPPLNSLKVEAWGQLVALPCGCPGMSWLSTDGGNIEWAFPLASWTSREQVGVVLE